MEIIRAVALISINETLIIQLVSFLVFLFLFNRLMIQPLRNVARDRERYLERIQNEAEEAANDTQILLKEVEAEKAKVRSEAFRISRQLEKEGNKTMNRLLDEARETIAGRRAAVKAEIGARLTETREAIESEAETLAVRMMEKILGRRL